MARNDISIFKNNLDSNCTESFRDDIDIVVDRRINYVMQKNIYSVPKKNINVEIEKAEQALTIVMPNKQQINLINDLCSAYEDLSYLYAENAYKQGFKDAMQLMFATNN